MCMGVLQSEYRRPWRPEEGVRSPRTKVTGIYEPPRGCWKQDLNLSVLHSPSPFPETDVCGQSGTCYMADDGLEVLMLSPLAPKC